MHDRDRWGGRGERDDAGRRRSDERWHGGVEYGGRGGYGRFDERAQADRDRGRAQEHYGDSGLRDPANRGYGRYDYADEGYGGAYRRDRDDRWSGGYGEPGWSGPRNESRSIEYDERTEYERRGDRWRRDAYERGGRERDANWGSAFEPSEARRPDEPRDYGGRRREPLQGGERLGSPRERDRQGYPSDRSDERQWMRGHGGPYEYRRPHDDDRTRGGYDRSGYEREGREGGYEREGRAHGGYEREGREGGYEREGRARGGHEREGREGGYERGERDGGRYGRETYARGGYEFGAGGFESARDFGGRRRDTWGERDRFDDREEAREARLRENPDRY